MNENNTTIIFGPPGTGKTTRCLDLAWGMIESGISPREICFVAFTRKAAKEARERAIQRFSLEESELPWFRTLHSLAFQQLGLSRDNVMGLRDYIKLCEALGLCITYGGVNEDGTFAGQTRGDRLFFMENMARARMLPLKEHWESLPDEDIYFYELLQLKESLENYKRENQKHDYTDIIHMFCESGQVPHIRGLIVDEAQDLSRLQWHMVERLSAGVDHTYVAGDDDQAIFGWAGAETGRLTSLPGRREILHQSYRVPDAIQKVSVSITENIVDRVKKEWNPRSAEGVVEYVTDLDQVDMSQGTWLLLARNAYLLDAYVQRCLTVGHIFEAKDSPISGEVFRAICAWEELRSNKPMKVIRIREIYSMMSTRVGVAHGFKGRMDGIPDDRELTLTDLRLEHGLLRNATEPWDVALDKVGDIDREYFLAAVRNGEKFTDPRIRVGTIHSAKGGEADNVVLQLDMAQRTWNEYQRDPDSEWRVWYVGVTRAKERLIILTAKTNKHIEL